MNVLTLSPQEQLSNITIQVKTVDPQGSGSGTGFLMMFCRGEDSGIPAVVTNKHVIAGCSEFQLVLKGTQPTGNTPDYTSSFTMRFTDGQAGWIPHPDPAIDLAVLPIGDAIQRVIRTGFTPFIVYLGVTDIGDDDFARTITPIEDVLMIGYPEGIEDHVNNMPLVRRGITATWPALDFQGRREFAIDCAIFQGSSGSPVLLFNPSGYADAQGNVMIGAPRMKLLGVLYAGPSYTAEGKLDIAPVPTHRGKVTSRIPMNLGYCIKASELRWFERHFADRLAGTGRPRDKS